MILGNGFCTLHVNIRLTEERQASKERCCSKNKTCQLVVMFTLQAIAVLIFLAFILKEHALPRVTGCQCTESSSLRSVSPSEYPDNTSK